jgi:hypothetical protein
MHMTYPRKTNGNGEWKMTERGKNLVRLFTVLVFLAGAVVALLIVIILWLLIHYSTILR